MENFGRQFSEVHFRKSIFGSTFSEVHYFRKSILGVNFSSQQNGEPPTSVNKDGLIKRNNLRRPERSLSTTSRTRTLTLAPAPAPSPGPKGDKRSSEIASSSAAPYLPADSMEELNRNLEVVKEKRVTIFDERKDEQLTTKDKGIFEYREKRRQ